MFRSFKVTESNKPKLSLVKSEKQPVIVTALVVPSAGLRDGAHIHDGALQATLLTIAFMRAFGEREELSAEFNKGGVFTADFLVLNSPWVHGVSDHAILLRKPTTLVDSDVYGLIFVGESKEAVEACHFFYAAEHGVLLPKVLSGVFGPGDGASDVYVITADMPQVLATRCDRVIGELTRETRLENIKVVK
jgi:hypothetical protein